MARQNVIIPSEHDSELAREALEKVESRSQAEEVDLKISARLLPLLRDSLELFAKGQAVALVPYHKEMTTQAAADLLNVSRPHLVKLLESGRIPFHRVGSHRRVRLQEVLAYKESLSQDRQQVLNKLSAQAQELNMGY